MYRLLLLSLLALAPFAAGAKIASSGSEFNPEKGLDLSGTFESQRSAILAALDGGKTYREISSADDHQVRASLDRIARLLDGKTSVNQLSEGAKIDAFNEQERINTLLTKAHADSRLVCKREKRVGSNRPTNSCSTVAELRRAREETQSQMNHSSTRSMPGQVESL